MIDDLGGFSQTNLFMRLAEKSDSQRLLEWRNHASVRRYSRNRGVISLELHEEWFERKLNLAESASKILIFSDLQKYVGMSRLDAVIGNSAEISILVEPSVHGKGFGSKILEQSIDYAFRELNYSELQASIHLENSISLTLFSKFGFVKVAQKNSFESYKLSKFG